MNDGDARANQCMLFGKDLPPWLAALGESIVLHPQAMPARVAARSPAFDQAILNYYAPGQGIKSHVDLLR